MGTVRVSKKSYTKKAKTKATDELRTEYTREDFPGGFVHGKYAERLREASNVVVLRPKVAAVFKAGEAVNDALMSLIKIAQKTAK